MRAVPNLVGVRVKLRVRVRVRLRLRLRLRLRGVPARCPRSQASIRDGHRGPTPAHEVPPLMARGRAVLHLGLEG
jgi:hypothetical protein